MAEEGDGESKLKRLWRLSRESTLLWLISRCCLRMGTPSITFTVLLFGSVVLVQYSSLSRRANDQLVITQDIDNTNVELEICKKDRAALLRNMHMEALEKEKGLNKTQKVSQGFKGQRVIHVDLKGAPPKMDYLIQLLPFFKRVGGTGILLEYEDMFPYKGNLRILSHKNAYSYDNIKRFLVKAKELNLEIIPLVQTFGHFEFVLKHKEFAHLRETKKYPNAPCPLHKQVQPLIFKMVDQVLNLHPHVRRLHIGGDEIFNLRDCSKCKESNKTKAELYLHHMVPILSHIISRTGGKVIPIIWDDMLRRWSVEEMKKISSLAEIMVWGYVPKLEGYPLFPDDMWDKYSKAFRGIWVASSFKGAIRSDANLPPIWMHIENHLSWLKIISRIGNKAKVLGVALTGWARFDHFASLCETLPAGIPALAICLRVLIDGQYTASMNRYVASLLGSHSLIQVSKDPFGSYDVSTGKYPGADVYSLVAEYENHVSWYDMAKNRIDSWGSKRHERTRSVSPLQVEATRDTMKQLLPSLKNFKTKCHDMLSKYFFEDAVKEWIEDKVDSLMELAKELNQRVKFLLKRLKIDYEETTS